MIQKLRCIFSAIVSAMRRAFWAVELRPPDLIAEGCEIQRIRACVEPEIGAGATRVLTGEPIWVCTDSMEIALNLKPAPAPPVFVKILDILRLSMV